MPATVLNAHGSCPECHSSWDGGAIFDALRPQAWCQSKSDEELHTWIGQHYSTPFRFSRLTGVELPHSHPEHYDGVSYWMCPDCRHQWPRFSK